MPINYIRRPLHNEGGLVIGYNYLIVHPPIGHHYTLQDLLFLLQHIAQRDSPDQVGNYFSSVENDIASLVIFFNVNELPAKQFEISDMDIEAIL